MVGALPRCRCGARAGSGRPDTRTRHGRRSRPAPCAELYDEIARHNEETEFRLRAEHAGRRSRSWRRGDGHRLSGTLNAKLALLDTNCFTEAPCAT